MTDRATAPRESPGGSGAHGVTPWAFRQLSVFLWQLVQVLPLPLPLPSTVGVLRVIARGHFHWLAAALCLVIMLAGVFGVGAFVFLAPLDLRPYQDRILWGGIMITMMFAGFVAGLVGRRIGGWEIYQALLVALAVVLVVLLQPPGDSDSALAFISRAGTRGELLLGTVWPAVVAIAAIAAFALAVFAGSFAFLWFGDRRFDPSFGYERMVGMRYVLTKGLSATAIVTVIGVSVGVATLLTVTAVMSGYQQDIQAKILSTNAHFAIQKYGMDFVEYDTIAAAGLADDEVVAGAPFVFNLAIVATGETALGVMVKGVIPERAGQVTDVESNLCETVTDGVCRFYATRTARLPQVLADNEGPALVMGIELLRKLRRKVGDRVILTSPVGIADARGNAPRRMEFRIAGAFRSGMHDFDARLVYTELGAAQRLLGMGDVVSGVEFKVRNVGDANRTAERVLAAIGYYPYRKLDWRKLNENIFVALEMQKILMFLILTFIVVVAAFNIASTLFMAVIEKARDIAIFKSMGAREGGIMKIFVLQGWLVGGAGTLLGVALGLILCAILSQLHIEIAADVYQVESLRVRVLPSEILLTAGAAVVISHLATLYPALKAARQRPVDAMRYE